MIETDDIDDGLWPRKGSEEGQMASSRAAQRKLTAPLCIKGGRVSLQRRDAGTMKARRWLIGINILLFAIPAFAQSQGDRAAYENAIAKIVAALPPNYARPNPITFFYNVGAFYCQMKESGEITPKADNSDIQDASRILRERDPSANPISTDDAAERDVAMVDAKQLLCP
jgi:hypothetical protein